VDTTPLTGLARTGGRLLAALLAPLGVGLLRLFPPLELAAPGGPAWLAAAATGLAAASLGLAMALALAGGLRSGAPSRLAVAAAAGTLTAGLVGAAFRAILDPAAFPDAGLPVAALVAAGLLLAARSVPDAPLVGVRSRAAAGVAIFVVVEAVLGASLLIATPPPVATWLLAAAAALAAAASLPGLHLGSSLAAGALVALSAGRPGSLDPVLALLALAMAGGALAWPSAPERTTVSNVTDDVVNDGFDDAFDGAAHAESPPHPDWTDAAAQEPPAVDGEATRLARELRGTIEELLHARRTIELQREELARASASDPLTGAASRRSILDRLRFEAAEARRYTHPVAVALIDIDGFAAINHAHSLAVGDIVLRELALRLRLRIREADALGRYGADSFLAILPHTDERGAAVFADAVRRRLTARPVETDEGEVPISVSIGVAFVRPGMTLSDEELLAAAEEALASARAAGGNRIAFDRLHGLARLEERRPATRDAGPGADAGADEGSAAG
jgi:diguanylate cyclase (GGDEF)-like protein